MMYTAGENPMVVDGALGSDYGVVDTCYDCGTYIYADDLIYDVGGRTLCRECGQAWFDENYGRYAE